MSLLFTSWLYWDQVVLQVSVHSVDLQCHSSISQNSKETMDSLDSFMIFHQISPTVSGCLRLTQTYDLQLDHYWTITARLRCAYLDTSWPSKHVSHRFPSRISWHLFNFVFLSHLCLSSANCKQTQQIFQNCPSRVRCIIGEPALHLHFFKHRPDTEAHEAHLQIEWTFDAGLTSWVDKHPQKTKNRLTDPVNGSLCQACSFLPRRRMDGMWSECDRKRSWLCEVGSYQFIPSILWTKPFEAATNPYKP